MSSDSNIDIIVIDSKIRNNFKKQYLDISMYKNRLLDIEDSLKNVELNNKNKTILENSYKNLLKYIIKHVRHKRFRIENLDLFDCSMCNLRPHKILVRLSLHPSPPEILRVLTSQILSHFFQRHFFFLFY